MSASTECTIRARVRRRSAVGTGALALAVIAGCRTPANPQPQADALVITAPAPAPAAASRPPRTPELVAGHCHTCALDDAGGLRCWGCNDDGQLGDGSFASRGTPTPVTGLGPVRDVEVGPRGTCVVVDAGAVACWGGNAPTPTFGAAPDASRPVFVAGISDAEEVAVGDAAACARTRAGEVHCWGADRYRRFAGVELGGVVRVDDDLGIKARAIRLDARDDACVLADDGRVICWGPDLGLWDPPQPPSDATPAWRSAWRDRLGGPREVAAGVAGFVAGAQPICVWSGEGAARRWRCLPDKLDRDLAELHAATDDDPTAAPALGVNHQCALSGGRVRCWGDDREDQVGGAARAQWSDVTALAAGSRYTCAWRAGGAFACWGDGARMATGDRSMTLTPEPPAPDGSAIRPLPLRDVADLSSGTCAIGQDGRLRCLDPRRGRPAAGLRELAEVSLGDDHTCARTRAGAVHCWGEWYFGPTNHDGDPSDFLRAAKPRRIAGLDAVALSSWGESDCAVARDGAIRCWGLWGDDSLRPVRQDAEGAGWIDIVNSSWWFCARRADGGARCRRNEHGANTPPIELAGVAGLSLARDRGCAAHRDSRVSCWGDGPTGDGTLRRHDAPVQLGALADVAEVSVGERHACARTHAGAILCWGANREGQLGDGTRVPRALPTASVQSVPRGRIVGVAALDASTIVWTDLGEAWIWGAAPGE